jgi:hypothetical protein
MFKSKGPRVKETYSNKCFGSGSYINNEGKSGASFCHQLPGVNFTNILLAAFAPKAFHQKITNPNCKHIKGCQRTLL